MRPARPASGLAKPVPRRPLGKIADCALLLAALFCVSTGDARAADQAVAEREAASERARIVRERADVVARAREAEAACAQEFAVSACTKQVRAERRAKLQQLEHQRALIDDAQRKRRAADRIARIRERQEAAQRNEEKAKVEVKTRTPRAPKPETAAPEETVTERAPKPAGTEAAQAARRAAAAKRRADEARAHREAIEARNRERAEKKAPAAPLPIPAPAPR